ncbi:MAG: hypothetical protein KQH67_05810 [Bacteroidetes bacterium]|nr:hypothetical protein [Bacteroidota bacterium]
MPARKTVLITPLNWGLGHATRMVPIIEYLLNNNANVLIAADKRPYDFLKQRFPETEIIRFPGFEPRYPHSSMMAVRLSASFPAFWRQSHQAHKVLQEIVKEKQVDIIVSDNRYECYSKHTYSIFITHQLQVQTKGFQKLFQPFITRLIYRYIKKYDELWIPDYEDTDENLSGKLSHVKQFPIRNYHFTGPLSRFKTISKKPFNETIDILVILSGPEPQRSILEELISKQALKTGLKTTILQSKPEVNTDIQKENIRIISHADDTQMAVLIQSASMIISRPGYSTIMDLHVFGKKAIFIPTPGQTEQEYLAKKMKALGYCYFEKQKSFELNKALLVSEKYTGIPKTTSQHQIESLIDRLLSGNIGNNN